MVRIRLIASVNYCAWTASVTPSPQFGVPAGLVCVLQPNSVNRRPRDEKAATLPQLQPTYAPVFAASFGSPCASHAPRGERLIPDITGRNSLSVARSCSLHNVISYPQPSQVVPFTKIERPRLENLGGVSPTRAEPRIGEKTMSELL